MPVCVCAPSTVNVIAYKLCCYHTRSLTNKVPVELCSWKYRPESRHSPIYPCLFYVQRQQERYSRLSVWPLESQATQGSGPCYLSCTECGEDTTVPIPAHCGDGRKWSSFWWEEKRAGKGSTRSWNLPQESFTGLMTEYHLQGKGGWRQRPRSPASFLYFLSCFHLPYICHYFGVFLTLL